MIEPSLAGVYGVKQPPVVDVQEHVSPAEAVPVAVAARLAELEAELVATKRQVHALACETGHVAKVERAADDPHPRSEVDPKNFGNSENLKHGLTAHYIEKPFRELEEELQQEGRELKLPSSIYTVAICAGFFCDGEVWDQMEAHAQKALGGLAKRPASANIQDGVPGESKGADAEAATPTDEVWGSQKMCLGFLKNIWFMLVNAFLLLIFHYFLTFCVLYFLLAHPYDTDPVPYNGTGFGDAWKSHFAQGECPSNIWIRTLCASLFACFVYFDMVQSYDMLLWLWYAPYNRRAIAGGKKASWFFPDELQIRIIPSPFAGRTGDPPEREIESRIPGLYRIFMVLVVIIPKMTISVALLFFGGKLVLRSDDSAEVIMNSLAAYFVAEMDEYVYLYLCPSPIQNVLSDEDTFPSLNMKTPEIDQVDGLGNALGRTGTSKDPTGSLYPAAKEKYKQRKLLVDAAIQKFTHWDANGDGELDELEVDFMLEECGISLSTPQVRQIVAYCDADRNGKVSLKELTWLLTCPETPDMDFNDPPDLKRWLQKQFQPRPTAPPQWKQVLKIMYKSLAPIVRILVLLSLTLILVVNYCDDLNPLDGIAAALTSSPPPPPPLCEFSGGTCTGPYQVMEATCTGTAADGAACTLNDVGDACMDGTGTCSFNPAQTKQDACLAATFAWTPAICATTEISDCASATADQATCEAAGACTFTPADQDGTATCATTAIPGCAGANADEETCTSFVPPIDEDGGD